MKKLELIIPNFDNDGSDNSSLIEDRIVDMCKTFGGVTVYQAKGHWIDPEGTLYTDEVSVLVSASQDDGLDEIVELAELVLEATDQKAVFVSHDGTAKIISK